MRSDLSNERNDLQTAIEFAESSDTSGFYEITNNVLDTKTHIQQLQQQNSNIDEEQQQQRNSRLRRTSRRTQPVIYFLMHYFL
jgi:hypothetical protein